MLKPLAKLVALLTPKRRWAQFSLGTMFLVVTLFCVWLAVVVDRANKQRDAVAAIKAVRGAQVFYDVDAPKYVNTFPKRFLRRWLPQDYLDEVVAIHLDGSDVSDADLAHLNELPALQELSINDTQVTDAGLGHLKSLTGLKGLLLEYNHPQLTDAGLKHLEGLTGLQSLLLSGTQVTDAGVSEFQKALPNCKIIR